MNLKHTLILSALAFALNGAFVANAADEKPAKEDKTEKTQPVVKKSKRHDHAEQNTQAPKGTGHDACCRDPSKSGKKPAHDHGEHNK